MSRFSVARGAFKLNRVMKNIAATIATTSPNRAAITQVGSAATESAGVCVDVGLGEGAVELAAEIPNADSQVRQQDLDPSVVGNRSEGY